MILNAVPGDPVTVPQDDPLQLVGPGAEAVQDAAGQVVALAQLHADQVRVGHDDWPEEVISQELEARHVEATETVSIGGEDEEGGLGDPLVVGEVETFVGGKE